jgi:hypothetical protein
LERPTSRWRPSTDGDLVLDPQRLASTPPLEQALRAAGFVPQSGDAVGAWLAPCRTAGGLDIDVPIDFMVPAAVSTGPGRRSARLPGHDARLARKVRGLAGALVDADLRPLASLETGDPRSFGLRIAGPAALLVAKLHKIQERSGTSRLNDKDALDVLRLLRGTPTENLAVRLRSVLADPRSGEVARLALPWLRELFGGRRGAGVDMALRSAGGLVDEAELRASSVTLVEDLLAALQR